MQPAIYIYLYTYTGTKEDAYIFKENIGNHPDPKSQQWLI